MHNSITSISPKAELRLCTFAFIYYLKRLSGADLWCEMCSFGPSWKQCETHNCRINVLRRYH